MIWLILALLGLLAAWVAVGVLMLARDARGQGGDYRREVGGRVYTVGDTVEVSLRVTAPASMPLADDHDIVLAIDHSGSMGGGPGSPMREALRAAENFIRRLPGNMHVAVVGFDHEARLLCPLTGEPRRALRAVAAIGSGGGTAIHSALERGLEALAAGRAGVRKTLILLSDGASDRDAALAAAEPLHSLTPAASVVCVGFGPRVDEELLRSISTGGDNYVRVDKPEDLYSLFSYLAAAVSGQMAVAGLVEEGTRAPDPFRLAGTGGLYPTGVQPENPTRVVWAVPLLDEAPVPLTYKLIPQCPGWHHLATPDSKAQWRMPDGSEQKTFGPRGPRVLVMPRWLGWAWPLLNPLFWTLFGRFWPCAAAARTAAALPEVEPLPAPALPAPLPLPQERLYTPRLRPALVVGLGEPGEWTVCRLKKRLRDREVEPGRVELFSVRVTHRANRAPARAGGVTLEAGEQIELHQDLRPYLETIRGGTPPMRSWVPWREWLAALRPLSTARTVGDDRRKSRLALLLKPEPVEAALAPGLRRVIEESGVVVLVGAPDDAECSGLLAEVAHVCAERGAGVTAVFARAGFDREAQPALALAQELERMTLMSGKQIASDRREPLASARKLFDRVVVLEQPRESAERASAPAAELIWDMLAFEEVFKSLPSLRADGGRVLCSAVDARGQALPAADLWRWVLMRTLAAAVNGRRLGLTEKDGRLLLPPADGEAVARDVESFWTGQDCRRPQNPLLRSARAVLRAGGTDPVSALLSLQDELPFDAPYHEQVAYSERERRLFNAYAEEWCQHILDREQEAGGWGVQHLTACVMRVEENLKAVVGGINRLSGNADFAILVGFAAALCADFLAVVSELRRGLADWLAALAGPQLEWGVGRPHGRQRPVCYDIEEGRLAAEEDLYVPHVRAREALGRLFDEWLRTHGEPLIGQLRFRAEAEPGGGRLAVRLRHLERRLEPGDDLAGALRAALDPYRNVILGRRFDEWLEPEQVERPFDYFRVGKYSGRAYPTVERVLDEDDPFTAAAVRVQERSLRGALGVESARPADPPYAWPEEANAARIAQKIRNRLLREPQPFTPVAVHLLRETPKLKGFFDDLARGGLAPRGTRFVLRRDGRDYEVGPADENLRGLDAFLSVMQQAVSLEVSLDGEPIPPPAPDGSRTLDETLRAVEAHPLAQPALGAPGWPMWQDLIRGLWLDGDQARR